LAMRLRAEVPDDETWKLTDLFESETQFNAAIEQADREQMDFKSLLSQQPNTPEELVSLLLKFDDVVRLATDINSYAFLKFSEDAISSENQARLGQTQLFYARFSETVSLLSNLVLKIPADVLVKWLEQHGELQAYSSYLTLRLNEAEHRLSDEVETVLSKLSSIDALPMNVYQTAIGADISFQPVKNSNGDEIAVTPFQMLLGIETSPDTLLRRRAYESLTNGLRPYQHTLAKTLGEQIQRDVTMSKVRKYPSVFHMLQDSTAAGIDYRPDYVEPDHFFMVQEIMFNELAPQMRRYARLRAKVLKLEESLICDLKAPLEPTDVDRISFERAKNIILQAAEPLGEEYRRVLQNAFNNRWIYRSRNKGNWNGAYCQPTSKHPWVFSPFGERLYDTLILGHELGHAVHMALATESQRPANVGFSSLFIETPSTLMEHLIAHDLRKTSDDRGMLNRVNMLQLFTFHHNFVTHQTEAEILKRLYQMAERGEPLSTDVMKDTSRKVLSDFWGDTAQLDEGADLYWMRQPHYYMGIYAYTYSVGLVASTVLSERIHKEGKDLANEWIRVLRSGGNHPPIEMFKMLGIDMHSPEPYRQAIAYVGRLVDELEASYGPIDQ
jgi:oligoendopeptidase F